MNTYLLLRETTTYQGTFGILTINGNLFDTGELPWRNNAVGISHIPVGTYQCDWIFSPHFNRNLYHIQNVPNRSDCLIHMGNWCGDVSKGLKSDVEGCIILGLDEGNLEGQWAVLESGLALAKFNTILNGASFMLSIQERYSD